MGKKITLNNIKQYIEGNVQMYFDSLGMKPDWYKEQIAYRMLQCKDDCGISKRCKYCGCDYPGKLYVEESCNNGERFPDLMNKRDWEKFKKDNNIE